MPTKAGRRLLANIDIKNARLFFKSALFYEDGNTINICVRPQGYILLRNIEHNFSWFTRKLHLLDEMQDVRH